MARLGMLVVAMAINFVVGFAAVGACADDGTCFRKGNPVGKARSVLQKLVKRTSTNVVADETDQAGCKNWCKVSQCSWIACKNCAICAPAPAPSTAVPSLKEEEESVTCPDGSAWCITNTATWAEKCTWNKCKGCDACPPTHAPTTALCKTMCATNTYDWSGKCKWKKCKGCSDCFVVPAPTVTPAEAPICDSICDATRFGPAAKCNWRTQTGSYRCLACKFCDKVKDDWENSWPPAAGGADWEEKCAAASSPKGKSNILVLMTDDMHADGGGPGAQMPNLDKLASNGVRFAKAYATSPICAPSRASIMTGITAAVSHYNFGRKGIKTGAMEMKWSWYENEVLANSMTFMEFFRSKCYLVLGTGKLNHDEIWKIANGSWPAEGQWDVYYGKADYGPYAFDGERPVPHPSMPQAMSDAFRSHVDFNWARMSDVPKFLNGGWEYRGQDYGRPSGPWLHRESGDSSKLPDEYNADWAIETIDKLHNDQTGQPWLLMVGFVRPHTPLYCPDKYYDKFPLDKIQLPERLVEGFASAYYSEAADTEKTLGFKLSKHLKENFPELEGFKKWHQAYYACVSFVDAQIGRVVDHLEKTEFWDNTIIAFFADNGWNNGPKGYTFKNAPWEDGTRVPLIIRAPGAQTKGLVSQDVVTLTDVYPTLLDLTGFAGEQTMKDTDKGAPLSGSTFSSLLKGISDDGRFAVSQIYPTYNKILLPWPDCNTDRSCNHWAVRSKDYRYIIYNNGMEELYEYNQDPAEKTNVADNVKYAHVRTSLREMLLSTLGMDEDKQMLGQWVQDSLPKPDCCKTFCATATKPWTEGKCFWNDCGQCDECEVKMAECPAPAPPKESRRLLSRMGKGRTTVLGKPEEVDIDLHTAALEADEDYENEWQMGAHEAAAIRESRKWFDGYHLKTPPRPNWQKIRTRRLPIVVTPAPTATCDSAAFGKKWGSTSCDAWSKCDFDDYDEENDAQQLCSKCGRCQVSTPVASVPDWPYYLADGSLHKCPDGDELVEQECMEAAQELQFKFAKTINQKNRPSGCFQHENQRVQFNKNKNPNKWTQHKKRKAICKSRDVSKRYSAHTQASLL